MSCRLLISHKEVPVFRTSITSADTKIPNVLRLLRRSFLCSALPTVHYLGGAGMGEVSFPGSYSCSASSAFLSDRSLGRASRATVPNRLGMGYRVGVSY